MCKVWVQKQSQKIVPMSKNDIYDVSDDIKLETDEDRTSFK
jgi:acetyl-CoA carboxylase carboxyltransferase component